jgi:hypothetical protein
LTEIKKVTELTGDQKDIQLGRMGWFGGDVDQRASGGNTYKKSTREAHIVSVHAMKPYAWMGVQLFNMLLFTLSLCKWY